MLLRQRPDDLLDRFRIERAAAPAEADAAGREPALGAGPLFVGFDNDDDRLDPQRAMLETPEPPRRRPAMQPFGPLASLAIHLLLPVLLLLASIGTPAVEAVPIPVQLVVEPPPPPPPPPPEKKPPPGRLSSDSTGEPNAAPPVARPAVEPAVEPPAETRTAAVAAPPPVPQPKPAAAPQPKPTPRAKPPVKREIVAHPMPSPQPAPVRRPGPSATRDEYLAYCKALIQRYYDMLPPAFIAGRRGLTTLAVLVLDDGTIARISIKRPSGYQDIDSRIEQMVAAVGRFPPLPQWVQGPSVVLYYDMPFPEGLRR